MKPGAIARKTIITRAHIVAFVMGNPRANCTDIAAHIGLTRMTVDKHLTALVQDGLLVRDGLKYSKA